MSVEHFENTRWRRDTQEIVFRHAAALELIDKGPVVDLGCGDGLLLELLKKHKNIGTPWGLDISEEAIAKCHEKGLKADHFNFSNGQTQFLDGQFAYATLLDVLEHVYFPKDVLREALRISKSVIVSVPNFSSLPARVQTVLGQVPENNSPGKGHVYWFTRDVLRRLCKDLGVEIVEWRTNTFWQDNPFLRFIPALGIKIWPSLFALSFVVKIKRL